jgi:exonuclease III
MEAPSLPDNSTQSFHTTHDTISASHSSASWKTALEKDTTFYVQKRIANRITRPPPPDYDRTLSDHNHDAPITIDTYNIRSGRNSNLQIAGRAFRQNNLDIIIVSKTKIDTLAYFQHIEGYRVITTKAPSAHQGGVALFYRDHPKQGWSIESVRTHGSNVLSCILHTGRTRYPIIGVYLAPSHLDDLPHIQHALQCFPREKVILLGDFNTNLDDFTKPRTRQILQICAQYDLQDMLSHFKQRQQHRDRTTWWQFRDGKKIKSRCDYILHSDRRTFTRVRIIEPRFYIDRLMVKAHLPRDNTQRSEHKRYANSRKRSTLI